MSAVTATEARRMLFPLIKRVNDDHTPVEIVSKHGNAILVSKEDWDSMEETAYLLRSPANAARLVEALAQAERGEAREHPLDRSA
jgi:antitoxin YefM